MAGDQRLPHWLIFGHVGIERHIVVAIQQLTRFHEHGVPLLFVTCESCQIRAEMLLLLRKGIILKACSPSRLSRGERRLGGDERWQHSVYAA